LSAALDYHINDNHLIINLYLNLSTMLQAQSHLCCLLEDDAKILIISQSWSCSCLISEHYALSDCA